MTTVAVGTSTSHVQLDRPWALSPRVAIRPEPFGALAYHFGNRRLIFLKQTELVLVVQSLAAAADVRAALLSAGVPEKRHIAFLAALDALAGADVIRPRADTSSS